MELASRRPAGGDSETSCQSYKSFILGLLMKYCLLVQNPVNWQNPRLNWIVVPTKPSFECQGR